MSLASILFAERLRGFVRLEEDARDHGLELRLNAERRIGGASETRLRGWLSSAPLGELSLEGRLEVRLRPFGLRYELAQPDAGITLSAEKRHFNVDPYAALTTLVGSIARGGQPFGRFCLRLDARDDVGWMLRGLALRRGNADG